MAAFFSDAIFCIQRIVFSPSFFANFSGCIVKPEVNISGRIIKSTVAVIKSIFSRIVALLSSGFSHASEVCTSATFSCSDIYYLIFSNKSIID